MKRAAFAVLSLLLWGCGPDALPPPSIVSVVPERAAQGDVSALSVRVSAVLPFTVDYGRESAGLSSPPISVELGGQALDVPFSGEDGTLVVSLPEHLSVGIYDLRVMLTDGRDAERADAFTVVPPPPLTGEAPGEAMPGFGAVAGFQLEPIGDQVRDVPFRITLRATGPGALAFQGPVSLRASHGELRADPRATFTQGVLTQEITLSQQHPNMYLMVEDAQGHRGLSNRFRVLPH